MNVNISTTFFFLLPYPHLMEINQINACSIVCFPLKQNLGQIIWYQEKEKGGEGGK